MAVGLCIARALDPQRHGHPRPWAVINAATFTWLKLATLATGGPGHVIEGGPCYTEPQPQTRGEAGPGRYVDSMKRCWRPGLGPWRRAALGMSSRADLATGGPGHRPCHTEPQPQTRGEAGPGRYVDSMKRCWVRLLLNGARAKAPPRTAQPAKHSSKHSKAQQHSPRQHTAAKPAKHSNTACKTLSYTQHTSRHLGHPWSMLVHLKPHACSRWIPLTPQVTSG